MSRNIILALLPVAACVGFVPARAAPSAKAVTVSGNTQSICKVGSSTTYNLSIVVVATGGGQSASRGTTITLDGSSGKEEQKNNTDATLTKNYTTICNAPSSKTLTLTAPQATKSGGGSIAYTFTVRNASDGAGTIVGEVRTPGSSAPLTVPPTREANWSIVVTAQNANGFAAGTYNATITIQ